MLPFTNIKAFYENTKQIKPLSNNEENALILKAKEGDIKAIEKVILNNSKCVFDFIHPCKINSRFDEDDLFQEGIIGLLKAIKTYDPAKQTKFKTYASHKIKKQISNYANKNLFAQKVPLYLRDIYYKIKKLDESILSKETYKTKSAKEIAKRLNLSDEILDYCLNIFNDDNNNAYYDMEIFHEL